MTGNLIKFALILILTCLLMGGGVAVLYGMWEGRIADREAAATQAAMVAVVPEGATVDAGKPLAGSADDGSAVYVARDAAGQPVAWVASGGEPGYSSVVKVMVGAGREGGTLRIHRVVVVSQSETPGLGAQVAEQKSNYTLWQKLFGSDEVEQLVNAFLDRFVGKGADEIQDIQAITAATITSDATKSAVDQALGRIRRATKDTP